MATSLLLIELVPVVLTVGAAFAAGWWAHWYRVRRRVARDQRERRLTQDVLANLHALIDNVSAEMDKHGDTLAEVNEGLTLAVTDEPRTVAASLTKLLVANAKVRERLEVAESRLDDQARTLDVHAAESRTDSLTQLASRHTFDYELCRCFAAYRRQERGFSIVLLDLDGFQGWNERFGRLSGDRVLARLGVILRDNSREMDLAARYGGDEFAMILPGTRLMDASDAADRIRELVAGTVFAYEDEQTRLTLSAGTAEVGMEDSVTTLLARAEAALRQAETAGGNQVCFHDGVRVDQYAGEPQPVG